MTEKDSTALPLVAQLRFTRAEMLRGLDGLSDEDARRRLQPMNCISWMVGHLAWQEHTYWLKRAQGKAVAPELEELVGWGKPASTPPLEVTLGGWRRTIAAADEYLDTLAPEALPTRLIVNGETYWESIGTMIQRVIYHYWYHLGEMQSVRQMLGHAGLAEYVGELGEDAPYRPG